MGSRSHKQDGGFMGFFYGSVKGCFLRFDSVQDFGVEQKFVEEERETLLF